MFPPDTTPPAGSAGPPPAQLSTSGGQPGQSQDPMAAVMSGVAPIKSAVDQIMQACQGIVKSGAVPGSEQICSQIVALSTSLLPMAVQQMMMPQGGAPQGGPMPPVGPAQSGPVPPVGA